MKTVVFGLLGTSLDVGSGAARWNKWRPTVALFNRPDFQVDRFHLLYGRNYSSQAKIVCDDIKSLSPDTAVMPTIIDFENPWDFEEVYERLHEFASAYEFDPENEEYLFHITTGTHVAQICIFLLAESRRFPGKLLQAAPDHGENGPGRLTAIDLDLSRYDRIASRFQRQQNSDIAFLKSGIETRNPVFNNLIELIERVALRSRDPILLTGATGVGKSRLAGRLYELRKQHGLIKNKFVSVNCSTLRGDMAMSTLFGHTKGAYTGASAERQGLLRDADGGMLFLDEIGELGMDEQAMLLHAIETKQFRSVGSDSNTTSNFLLVCGTNRNLSEHVAQGRFREDLFARINLWTFDLPNLRDRPEDIHPNITYELDLFERDSGRRVVFNKEAMDTFTAFAASPAALWKSNFRDLDGAVRRMCTMADGARIAVKDVNVEILRLKALWGSGHRPAVVVSSLVPPDIDEFDRIQLDGVLKVCSDCDTLAEAGRKLFSSSRERRTSLNDTDRLRKYLSRFGVSWEQIKKTSA